MSTRTFDLGVARAQGDTDEGRKVVVTASKLVIKRVESPVTLIIERDDNDRISIAAGELRTLKADDCRPIGTVRIENEEGSGELELYWSELICMSAESGKADAASGAAAIEETHLIIVPTTSAAGWNGAAITPAGLPGGIATVGAGGALGTGINAATGRYGHAATNAGAAGNRIWRATNLWRYGMVDILNTLGLPSWGRGYVAMRSEMYADCDANSHICLGVGETAQSATPQMLGFRGAANEYYAWFRNWEAAPATLIAVPLGVSTDDGVHTLDFRAGYMADGTGALQWWIDGVLRHEHRTRMAAMTAVSLVAGEFIVGYGGGAGSVIDCLVLTSRGARVSYSERGVLS